MDTQEKVIERVREIKRARTSNKLNANQGSKYLRYLYDPRAIKGPINFYCQSPDGCPLAKVPSRVAGETIHCTVASINQLRADIWKDQGRPEDFGASAWPPTVVAHLLGCSTVGDVCMQCKMKKSRIHTADEYLDWSAEMYSFWLDNIRLSRIPVVKGYGLIARNDIEAGTIIGEYTGELTPKDDSIPDPDTEYNCDIDIGLRSLNEETQAKAWLDATHKGSIFRFMNHSCDSNTKMKQGRCGIHNRIMYIYTTKNIQKGDQITVNYGEEWWLKSDHSCLCGTAKCYKPPSRESEDEEIEGHAKNAKENKKQQHRAAKSDASSKSKNRQQAKEFTTPVRISSRRHGRSNSPSGRESPKNAAAASSKVRKRLIRHGPIKLESVDDDDYSVRRPAALNSGNNEGEPSGKKVVKKTGRAKHRS
jgi:hypothetical protein